MDGGLNRRLSRAHSPEALRREDTMKLRWENRKVTTPAEIENHNNMVETLWKWRHAGLVVETENGETLPQLIEKPRRVIACKCGNDDLHEFTLMSLGDVGIYSLNHYEPDGSVEASHSETDYIAPSLALEFGLARKAEPGKRDDGTEYDRFQFLWILSCDKCREQQKIWSNELDEFIEWN